MRGRLRARGRLRPLVRRPGLWLLGGSAREGGKPRAGPRRRRLFAHCFPARLRRQRVAKDPPLPECNLTRVGRGWWPGASSCSGAARLWRCSMAARPAGRRHRHSLLGSSSPRGRDRRHASSPSFAPRRVAAWACSAARHSAWCGAGPRRPPPRLRAPTSSSRSTPRLASASFASLAWAGVRARVQAMAMPVPVPVLVPVSTTMPQSPLQWQRAPARSGTCC